ncbi:hypothetical protein AB685_15945 [Bacillus sp. LL01]|nr:hypothetical protein AB685_15945 [Bacillus sp. LL01]
MFTFKQAILCPYCGENQYLTKSSRQKLCLLPMVFPLLTVPFISFGIGGLYLSIVYFICFVSMLSLIPFLYKLSNENEPLW